MLADISTIFGAIVSGVSLGAILLALAKKYNKKKLGYTGLFLTLISHFLLGFLGSLPCFAIIFTLILKDTREVEYKISNDI